MSTEKPEKFRLNLVGADEDVPRVLLAYGRGCGGEVAFAMRPRDNTALLKTTDDLRKVKEVQGLKIEQIRGKAPQQFTFTFRWNVNSSTP